MRADVVEGQEPAVLGQEPADLAEDTVDHRDMVGRGVVDHEVELSGREAGGVDVHLLVRQRKVVRTGLPLRLLQQRFGEVDADGLPDDAGHHHLPLDPSVPTVEEQPAGGTAWPRRVKKS